MRRRQFIAALPLFSATAFAQRPPNVNGVYQLYVPYKNAAAADLIVMMRQVGGELKVKNLATGQEYRGTVSGNNVAFDLLVGGTPTYPAMAMPHSFSGAVTQAGLTGQVEAGGSKVEWYASRLNNVWLCSNHQPVTHTAKSKEDMVALTQKNKCEGWRRARPEDLG